MHLSIALFLTNINSELKPFLTFYTLPLDSGEILSMAYIIGTIVSASTLLPLVYREKHNSIRK